MDNQHPENDPLLDEGRPVNLSIVESAVVAAALSFAASLAFRAPEAMQRTSYEAVRIAFIMLGAEQKATDLIQKFTDNGIAIAKEGAAEFVEPGESLDDEEILTRALEKRAAAHDPEGAARKEEVQSKVREAFSQIKNQS